MKTINKDITTVDFGVIVHQVNCQGVMGSGVAKSIRDKWPKIFDEYKRLCDFETYSSVSLLGKIDVCLVSESLFIVNLFGQNDYRRNHQLSPRFTSYAAWEKALPTLADFIIDHGLPSDIYFPYFCGCDRGGGDWRIISAMIEEYFPNAVFCKYQQHLP